jgi:signal transduction histidine kinase/DNA-binding NarL/FixJ family response regulator
LNDSTPPSGNGKTKTFLGFVMLLIAVVGIGGTMVVGQHLKRDAHENWLQQAEAAATQASLAAEGWVAQASSIMSGLAVAFRAGEEVSADDFSDLVFDAEEWHDEFSLNSVAVVERVLRTQRKEMEALLGKPITVVGKPDMRAPEIYESFVVRYSSDEEGDLRPQSDLMSNPQMATVVSTAYRLPGQVVMGPAYNGVDGKLYSLAGLNIKLGEKAGVLVGEINVSELISFLESVYAPAGMVLRIAERDTETQTTSLLRPIYGTLEPHPDALHTTVIRITHGQARWNFYWDVLPTYLGEPHVAVALGLQAGGVMLTLLVIAMIGFLGYQNALVKKVVDERTASLRKSTEEAKMGNRAKSEFLASMSHEIRTPMTGVIGFADMLLKDDLEHESREKVNQIKGSTNALLRIINDILDMSKLEAGKMEIEDIDFDLPALIDDVLSLFEKTQKKGTRIELILRLSDDFPQGVNSDPTRIRQTLVNLLGNAIKFTQKGRVTIEGCMVKADDGGGEMLRFSIQDTGIGMTEETIAKLFSEFTQADASINRKFEGTGLGLAICDRLVKLMGGEIGAESTIGKGSKFWFTLPYVAATSDVTVQQKTTDATHYESRRTLNILLAEDNQINQIIIMSIMNAFGHQVDIAINGREAVTAHEKANYDLILMDVRMPEMSGPEATRIIRQSSGEKQNIPIIAVTADAMKEHTSEYLAVGMNACVTKPIDQVELLETINQVMGEEIHVAKVLTIEDAAPDTEEPPSSDDDEPNAAVDDFLAQIGGFGDEEEST